MVEIIGCALVGGALVMLISLVATEIENWRKRRRLARIQQIERDLAQTRSRLEALAMQHQAWLHGQAHEARKALILESFYASREARNNAGRPTRRS